MAADLEQQKHRCKICSKGFSSGRSLGGHMRSHMRPGCLDAEEDEKHENGRGQVSFRAGYGLRENPKKTCRLSDFIGEDFVSSSKDCNRECGEEFPSWKALFDRMVSQSEMTYDRSSEAGEMEEQEDGSWCAQKLSIENFSDGDEPLPLPAVPKRKRRSNRVASPIIAASSSIIDYESEQEDVAISLMMLSRGIGGYWVSGISGAGESSDKHSVAEEKLDEEVSAAKLKTKGTAMAGNNTNSGSRYRCTTCDKSFHSYHALGGHRASHKKIRTSCDMLKTKGEGSKNAGVHDGTTAKQLAGMNQKSRVHECFICGKVFSSGNALGGHRRSHLVFNGSNVHHETAVISELPDLNLQAQADEGASSSRNEPHPVSSIFD